MESVIHWRPQRIWAGETAVVVAPGASLTCAQIRTIALAHQARRCRVLAIREAAYCAWFADVAYAPDGRWWNDRKGLQGFCGLRVQLDDGEWKPSKHANALRKSGNDGYDPEPGAIRSHGNAEAQAVQLASHLGARRILLVGFDMKGNNFFGLYDVKLQRAQHAADTVARFTVLHDALKIEGVEIVNATPASALSFLKQTPIEAALSA